MNWTQVEGKWGQVKGQLRSKWSKLTDDDIGVLDGKRETLVGKLTERYGIMKDDAEKEIDGWLGSLDSDSDSTTRR